MGWAGDGFSPLLSPPPTSRLVGRLPPGCCCRVGGWTGNRQAVSNSLASFLNESVLIFLLGPPGRRGKPGRRGDPGESQVLLVPKPRPGSLPLTRYLAGSICPLPPHYSGPLVLGQIFPSLPIPATVPKATVPKTVFSWLLDITVPVALLSMPLAAPKSHRWPQKLQPLASHSEAAPSLCGN